MIYRAALVVLTLTCVSFLDAPSAQAQECGYGAGIGWGYAGNYFGGFQGVNQKRVPYFALYPPVYYEQKVARPYGFSPFATPPTMLPAEMIAEPKADFKEIVNPYFESDGDQNEAEEPAAQPISRSRDLTT